MLRVANDTYSKPYKFPKCEVIMEQRRYVNINFFNSTELQCVGLMHKGVSLHLKGLFVFLKS